MTSAPAIDDAGGAVPFSRFVELALYGPHGFYTDPAETGSAGRRGRSSLSACLRSARCSAPSWPASSTPSGNGWSGPIRSPSSTPAPARGRWRAPCSPPGRSVPTVPRYLAVQVSAFQRARHPADVDLVVELPALPVVGVVLANELLDNLPFRLRRPRREVARGRPRRRADDAFAEVLSAPFDPVPEVLPATAVHGARAPLQDAAAAWVAEARRLVRRGSVVVVDYARPSTSVLAGLEWRAWLRTYRYDSARRPPTRRSG